MRWRTDIQAALHRRSGNQDDRCAVAIRNRDFRRERNSTRSHQIHSLRFIMQRGRMCSTGSIKDLTPIQLRPEIAPLFAGAGEIQPPLYERTPHEVRELMDGLQLQSQQARPADIVVQDLLADLDGRKLRLRLYKPKGTEGPLPIVIYIHGGGWVLGNIETHDRYVCFLTQASGVAFVSVDYRLAPEHPYPACIDDAFDSLRWIHARAASLGLDPDRIGLCGDSAGGQIVAACTLLARERGGPRIGFQSLIYPLTDCDFSRPSYHRWTGMVLTRPFMKWFWRHWYGNSLPV